MDTLTFENKEYIKYSKKIHNEPPFDDICKCGHWKYQHNSIFLILYCWNGNCQKCSCNKFQNNGKVTLKHGNIVQKTLYEDKE